MTFVDSASAPPGHDSAPYAEDMFPDHPEEQAKGIAHASGGSDDLPFGEDMFPDHPLPGTTGAVAPGPVGDWLFGDTQHSSLARIMHAFGQGVEHAVGPKGENLKLSEETEKYLKQKGVFNDYAAGQYNVLKGLNETLLRGGAVMVNSAIYGIPVAISGIQGAVAEAGEQAEGTRLSEGLRSVGLGGTKSLARELAAVPEAFPNLNFRGGMPHRPIPEPLAVARDVDVIGPGGEAAWKGVAPVEEAKAPTTAEAAPAEAAPVVEAPPVEPPPVVDVHAAARAIDPKTFTEYDALAKRRDTFRKWIEDPEDAGRDLSKVATNLKETEARLKELEPAVAQAYGKVREGIEPEPASPQEAAEAKPTAETPPATEPAPAATPAAPRAAPIAEQKAYIAADVQRQIIAAGKPENMTPAEWRQHAKDAGKIAAARYEARAAWFDGKRGTAQELYDREAPEILGHGQRSQENVAPRAPRKVNEEKLSLAQFLAHRGGLQETPDLRHILDQNPFIPGFGRLFRRDGMTEDRAREAASEAGYLFDNQERTGKQATVKDLHEALSEENRGRKRYRMGHEPEAARVEGPEHEEFPEGLEPHEMAAAGEDQLGHLSEEDREFLQSVRGSVQFRENQAPVMRILRAANASTYIHESGHVFLEELMRDAAHEAAPEALKTDAKTVQDWLGIESHADLNTGWPGARGKAARAAHEKFATGFEQYLREGVAPSKELAAVFARFRDWLVKLYDTIAGLGHPINEDIKGVFDRLLAKDPERTVIAPERAAEPGFDDLHEAHAEAAPPERAHEVANTVQAERDSQAPHNLVENEDARLENVDDASRSRETGSAEPAGDANEVGSSRSGAGTPAQAGEIGAGGSEAAAQGDRVPPKPESAVKSEPPAAPNAKFTTSSSGLIDKAGNIRLDKLATGDDVLDVIRETAAANNDFLAERRGVLSDGDTLNLSDALGMDPAWLDRKKIGDAFNVEEIRAARRLLVQSATGVRDAMIAAKNGATESVVKLAEAIARHEMIQGKVAQATAEAGRALRAFREVIPGEENIGGLNEWLKQNTGRTLFQLQEMARLGADLTSPSQVSRFVHDTANGKIRQAVIFYYVNALISGPITHARYFVGNVLTMLWSPLVKTPIAATLGAGRDLLGLENAERVYLGESGPELYGLLKGSREGWRAAREGWETGNTPQLPGEGAPQLFEAQPTLPPIPGKIGYAIGLPGKVVGAIHGFSSAVRYEQEIHRLAYRSAMSEKLAGEAFTNRVAELTNRPTAEMTEVASTQARKDLYMAPTEYDSLAGKLTRAANHNVFTKIIVPFMKIGTQITRNALIEASPLGVFDKKVRENLSGKNGGAARDMQAASMIGGTALMGAMAMMASEGLATGDGPADPGKRAVWLLSHHPNSLQVGSVTIPYQGLGSLGMLMRLSANAYETHRGWGDDEGHSIALDYLHGFEKSVLDENFLRGVKDMIDAVYHYEEYGDRYIASMITNWMPFSVGMGQVTRTFTDPWQRETRGASLIDTIWKDAQAKIPLVSQTLMPRRDMFGEPIPSSGPVQNYVNDPTVRAMDEIHMKVGRLEHKIRGVALTDKQYDDFARVAGRTAKLLLDEMVRSPGFNQMLPNARAELMHKAISHARQQGANTVIMQAYGSDNDILKQATDAKKIKKGIMAPPETVH